MALALITDVRPARTATALWLALLVSSASQASGSGPEDVFVQRHRPDMPRPAYLQGELGLLLPSFGRVHLYAAWRALASADAGMPLKPVSLEAFELACCDAGAAQETWGDTPYAPAKPWLEARARVQTQPPRRIVSALKSVGQQAWTQFLNCPPDAFRFATETLVTLQQRSDATPARLRSWVQAQDQVFEFCSHSQAEPPPWQREAAPLPVPLVPDALPDSEPLLWRQARNYQQAAAAFYAGDWARAQPAFGRIAADGRHPWQAWAALAELRTVLRQASLQGHLVPEPVTAAQALLQHLRQLERRIGAQASWAVQQRAAAELLNLAEARLRPRQRLIQLGVELGRLDEAPPTRALADWARLADAEFADKPTTVQREFRHAAPLLDWIDTLQRCDVRRFENVPPAEQGQSRVRAFEHARSQWQARPGALWLLPMLSCSEGRSLAAQTTLWRAAQRAVESSSPAHPATPTLQWQWVRLLREAGDTERARALLTPLLSNPTPSLSTGNLLRQEALALARTLDEAAPWLGRRSAGWRDADTGASGGAPAAPLQLAADGARWLSGLSLEQWEALLNQSQLAATLRQPLAIALWWRAELLGQTDRARRVAQAALQRNPALMPVLSPYLSAADAPARREALWRAGLLYGLSARVHSRLGEATAAPKVAPQEAAASQWCRIDAADDPWGDTSLIEQAPPALFPLAPEAATEQAALKAIGSATGAYSHWLLARIQRKPLPADLDWLLYVGVQSSRGGCVDADNGATSQAMFRQLHQRFPASPWAKKTPYWYR